MKNKQRKKAGVQKPVLRRQPTPRRQASVAAAYSTRSQGSAPKIQATRDSSRIRHREFLGNITGSVAWTIGQTIAVNPGLQSSFPWLSVSAQAWEQYKFHKLRYCYYTRTGTNIPGSVLMSPDYDAADAAPASEQIQSTYDDTVEDAPWKDICLVMKPDLMAGPMKRHYIRNGALSANSDIKLYDVANVYIGTVDGTAVSWGKLWVEYDVEFFIPQLPPNGGLAFGSVSGTTGTAASLITSAVTTNGNLISGLAGNVLSLQNMIIGNEYLIQSVCSTCSSGYCGVPSAPVGLTLKTALKADGVNITAGTYTATANVGSLTLTSGGNTTNVLTTFSLVPTLAF